MKLSKNLKCTLDCEAIVPSSKIEPPNPSVYN